MRWQRVPDPLGPCAYAPYAPDLPSSGLWFVHCTLARATQAVLVLFRVYLMGITVPPCPDWLATEHVFGQQSDFRPTLLVADLYSALLSVCSLCRRSVGPLVPPHRYAILVVSCI
jgi:hypothetical protein